MSTKCFNSITFKSYKSYPHCSTGALRCLQWVKWLNTRLSVFYGCPFKSNGNILNTPIHQNSVRVLLCLNFGISSREPIDYIVQNHRTILSPCGFEHFSGCTRWVCDDRPANCKTDRDEMFRHNASDLWRRHDLERLDYRLHVSLP